MSAPSEDAAPAPPARPKPAPGPLLPENRSTRGNAPITTPLSVTIASGTRTAPAANHRAVADGHMVADDRVAVDAISFFIVADGRLCPAHGGGGPRES